MNDTPIKAIMGLREWAMLVALSMVWGGSFLFVGVSVRELPPLTLVLLRVGLAALALLAVLRLTGIACRASGACGPPFSAWEFSTTSSRLP